MEEYAYNNIEAEEIENLFSNLPETDSGVILLQKGCKTDELDEACILGALYKGWSVVI